jgi:hypothetical protein
VTGSQAPAIWHSFGAVQTTGLPPTQTPPWQALVWVQALPSSQAALSAAESQSPVVGLQV